jgi:hypothetical protein
VAERPEGWPSTVLDIDEPIDSESCAPCHVQLFATRQDPCQHKVVSREALIYWAIFRPPPLAAGQLFGWRVIVLNGPIRVCAMLLYTCSVLHVDVLRKRAVRISHAVQDSSLMKVPERWRDDASQADGERIEIQKSGKPKRMHAISSCSRTSTSVPTLSMKI